MNIDRLFSLAEQARNLGGRHESLGSRDWYSIKNAKTDTATLDIYGPIGISYDGEGVTAAQFVKDLRDVTASSLDVHINSPGGLVFDGVTIYGALKSHKSTVNVSIDGLAASAASFVAMAGDDISIQKPAKMMIHDAQGIVIGNASDMHQMADLLDELSDTIAEIYSDRTDGTVDEWRTAMQAETWYSAEQAVASGLADRVVGDTKAAPESKSSQMIRARARLLTEGFK